MSFDSGFLSRGLSSSLSLPSLPSDLKVLYDGMCQADRKTFLRVYRVLWDELNRQAVNNYGMMAFYWSLASLVHGSALSPSYLALLSYIYLMSDKGRVPVHSEDIYNSNVLPELLTLTVGRMLFVLKRDGYITRSTKDMTRPYVQKAQHNRHPVFISITPAGVKLIEDIERAYRRMILDNSLQQLTGNKKAR